MVMFPPVRLDCCEHGWRRTWSPPCPLCSGARLADEAGLYWHGGAPGRVAGDWIAPPATTGASGLHEYLPEHLRGTHEAGRTDRVYVGTEPGVGALYAGIYCDKATRRFGGTIYRVRPVMPLEVDPDAKTVGLSYACRAALVLDAHELTKLEALSIARRALGRGAVRGKARRWGAR